MVRFAVGIGSRWDDANRLPFEHGEWHAAKIQHDVVGVVVVACRFTDFGHAHVACNGCSNGFFSRLGAVQVGIGVGRRPWRNDGTKLGRVKA